MVAASAVLKAPLLVRMKGSPMGVMSVRKWDT